MNKLRSDSAFCQLTPQQVEALEGWLFEERLGYPKVVEKLKAEFGLETSLTGVRRFYKRLEMERSRESLMDAVEMSGLTVEALKSGDLKPAMLLLANKCAFELMMKSDPPIRKVTALLRAITSAEARAFRQTVDDREQAELRERERVRKVEEERSRVHWRIKWEDEEERRQKRAARKKAQEEATEKAAKGSVNSGVVEAKAGDGRVVPVRFEEPAVSNEPTHPLTPTLSPSGGEGEGSEQQTIHEFTAPSCALGNSPSSKDGKGDESGAPASGTAPRDTNHAWQPSVVEQSEYAEKYTAEAAENRLTPLNAA